MIMKSKYVIGVDYGTLSARAIVVDVGTGQTLATAVEEYPHGVMVDALPDGTPLPKDWALQHPADYLKVLLNIVPKAVAASGVKKDDIIAIGTDFTASTTMPVAGDGWPLCLKPEYSQALYLIYFENMTNEEASQVMKKSKRQFENLLYRGKQALKEALRKENISYEEL